MNTILPFSNGVFYILDKKQEMIMYDWDTVHVQQGFVREKGFIAVATLLPWGIANLEVVTTTNDMYDFEDAQRLIAIPLTVTGDSIVISSLDEPWGQSFELSPGFYRVFIAQKALGEGTEVINIVLEQQQLEVQKSIILKVDPQLDPPNPLIETANRIH
jgi:hypothetical protein